MQELISKLEALVLERHANGNFGTEISYRTLLCLFLGFAQSNQTSEGLWSMLETELEAHLTSLRAEAETTGHFMHKTEVMQLIRVIS